MKHTQQNTSTPRAKAPPRPKPLTFKPENIPARLRRLHQWIGWDYERDERGKWTKVPKALAGYRASSTNPRDWSSFDEVLAAHQRGRGSGLGYVTTADDGYTLIDCDHVVDPTTGAVAEWAMDIVRDAQRERGSYCEISVSGTGLHLFLRSTRVFDGVKHIVKAAGKAPVLEASMPGVRTYFRDANSPPPLQALEIYTYGRFLTMSGWRWP